MHEQDKKRRTSLLAALVFDPVLTPTQLRHELEITHNVVASVDLVRADLTWLDEVGLVRFNGNVAGITERGRDVVRGSAKFPGDA